MLSENTLKNAFNIEKKTIFQYHSISKAQYCFDVEISIQLHNQSCKGIDVLNVIVLIFL